MNSILTALWFFLPAAAANAAPVFASRIPILKQWKTPMDFHKTYQNERILGNNKTLRGLVFGIIVGAFIAWLQLHLIHVTGSPAPQMLYGAILGFGALLGDAVESFFKRRRGIASGHSWFPFDQIDYIIGGLLFIWPFVSLGLAQTLAIIFAYFVLHLVGSYIGYRMGLKKRPI